MFEGELLEGERERLATFWLTLCDGRFPYRHFEGVRMTDERYSTLAREHDGAVASLRQIALRSFPQKTKEASAALSVLGSMHDADERVVAMAQYLDAVRTVAGARR